MIYVFCLLAIVVFITVLSYALSVRASKQIEAIFANIQIDERSFSEKYVELRDVPFSIVERVRKVFEEELSADSFEDFDENGFFINPGFYWTFDSRANVVTLQWRLEEEFDIEISDRETKDLFRTVDSLINLIWRKVKEKNGARR